jgi:membrane protein DedA with SNARE-associated domain
MNLGALIESHGYWVLAIGCLLEGETLLVLAGFAAHRGYLNPGAVLAIAATAGFVGDQFYFWLGRRHGPAILSRWPSLADQSDRVDRLLRATTRV